MTLTYDSAKIRRLQVSTNHGTIDTPAFMPIATRGVVKGLTSSELNDLGSNIILGNTYHLWLNPGLDVIKKTKVCTTSCDGTNLF